MGSLVERVIDAWPADQRAWILPATRADTLRELDRLRTAVEAMGPFEEVPEGAAGVVLLALLATRRESCPDAADLEYFRQGCEPVLRTSYAALAAEMRNGPEGPPPGW